MDATRAIALGALGSSGVTSLSGSLFTEAGSRSSTRAPIKLENPFYDIDLYCTNYSRTNNKVRLFKDLENRVTIKNRTRQEHTLSKFELAAPSATTEKAKGCMRATFHAEAKLEKKDQKPLGVSIEVGVEKGNYGIILVNAIANSPKYGGRINVFKALFLEKEKGKFWKFRGGVVWTDQEFLDSVKKTKMLKWKGLSFGREKTINWENDGLRDFVNHEQFSIYWKDNTSTKKKMFQELVIEGDPAPSETVQSFWSGKEDPWNTNPSLAKPTGLLDPVDLVWKKPSSDYDVNKVKAWFELLKDEKGSWGTMP